ncbi:MAG: histidyl-tRNA synthetase, partial [Crocinitomicaceae bacterium]
EELGLKRAKVKFDVTLARGLNYYTGAIFEVKANGVNMGSICGGGRYDDLTGIFGMKDMSGVGISFGADRIYDVLTELNLFPEAVDNTLDLLFINFGEVEEKHCLKLVQKMRAEGISSELYPSSAKMKKQMKYANDRNVKNVALIGQDEIDKGILLIKNMESGEQTELSFDQAITQLKA